MQIRCVNNATVYASQIARLEAIHASRDSEAVSGALRALTVAASGLDQASDRSSDEHNLLRLAVNAARLRATVGEISGALEEVWGRHKPSLSTVAGAYSSEFGEDDAEIVGVRNRAAAFNDKFGKDKDANCVDSLLSTVLTGLYRYHYSAQMFVHFMGAAFTACRYNRAASTTAGCEVGAGRARPWAESHCIELCRPWVRR
jgi:hypothetical protein